MNNSEESAFPHPSMQDTHKGLTKREYFAAMAMQGILAGRNSESADPPMKWAVQLADELLKELEG